MTKENGDQGIPPRDRKLRFDFLGNDKICRVYGTLSDGTEIHVGDIVLCGHPGHGWEYDHFEGVRIMASSMRKIAAKVDELNLEFDKSNQSND